MARRDPGSRLRLSGAGKEFRGAGAESTRIDATVGPPRGQGHVDCLDVHTPGPEDLTEPVGQGVRDHEAAGVEIARVAHHRPAGVQAVQEPERGEAQVAAGADEGGSAPIAAATPFRRPA